MEQAVVITGQSQIVNARGLALKGAMGLVRRGMTHRMTKRQMMDAASVYTGKTYGRGQFGQAHDDMVAWARDLLGDR